MGIITWRIRKKSKEAEIVIEEIEKHDNMWNHGKLEEHIEETFYKVQEAWMERNQDIAKDYISNSLYEKHKAQTDGLLVRHHTNVLKDICLEEIKMLGVSDYKEDDKDFFWAYIKGSMADYYR